VLATVEASRGGSTKPQLRGHGANRNPCPRLGFDADIFPHAKDTIDLKDRLLWREGGIEFPTTMADEELSRYLTVLADLVKEKKIALTKLDRLLGWRGGMVGRLLRGERDLRLSQLLAILSILQVEPLSFFRVVHADRSISARLMESLAAAAPASAPLVVPPLMSEREFSKLLRTALDDALTARETRGDVERPQED
jgi:hypothetical protein